MRRKENSAYKQEKITELEKKSLRNHHINN